MSINKTLLLDIHAISLTRQGVSYFYWPIDPYEVGRVCTSMRRAIVAILREAEEAQWPGVNAGVILKIHFVQEVMACYQAHLLISRTRRDGFFIKPAPKNRLIKAFLQAQSPLLPSFIHSLRGINNISSKWRLILRCVHDLMLGFRQGVPRLSLFSNDQDARIVTLITTRLAKITAKELKKKILYQRPSRWFSCVDPQKVGTVNQYDTLIEHLLQMIQKEFSIAQLDFPEYIRHYLQTWLKESIPLVEYHFSELSHQKNKIPKQLWANTQGNVWGSLLARYIKSRGGEVWRYTHTSGGGYYAHPVRQDVLEFEDCSTFVTVSDTQARLILEAFTGQDVVQRECPQVVAMGNENYFKHYAHTLNHSFRRTKKKTVMYVAPIYPGEFVYQATEGYMSDIVLLDWETRLIDHLQQWNYPVLLKPHPVESQLIGSQPPESLTRLFGPIVRNELFEKIFHRADVVILDNSATTLFTTLIMSNKPFVYIDFKVNALRQEARELLGRRCPIIKGQYDGDHRAYVEWESLHQAIEVSHTYHDRAFADTYFYTPAPAE